MSTNDFHRVSLNNETVIRGAARVLWAGTTIAFPTSISDVIDTTVYNAQSGWNDLGATKTGVTISVNNAEDVIDIDQYYGDIDAFPNNWECSVQTALAEMSLERLTVAWEGSAVTTDTGVTPNEKEMGFGLPTSYTKRRIAVLHQKTDGKIRGYFFRKVVRAAQESAVAHNKAGDQQSVPIRFRAFADTSIADVYKQFFIVRDQV